MYYDICHVEYMTFVTTAVYGAVVSCVYQQQTTNKETDMNTPRKENHGQAGRYTQSGFIPARTPRQTQPSLWQMIVSFFFG